MDKRYRAILYDIDGTLVNTLDMNMYPLLQIIKEETGEEWNFCDVVRFCAYPGKKVIEELGFKPKEEVYQRWVSYVNRYEKGSTCYDGIQEVVTTFATHHILQGIVSSKNKKQFQIDIKKKALDTYMKTIVLAEDVTHHKPHPEPLEKALKNLKLNASEVLYIGDAYSDYKAAHAAKMDFGYAKWGNPLKETIPEATYTFHKPLDLLTILDCFDPSLKE